VRAICTSIGSILVYGALSLTAGNASAQEGAVSYVPPLRGAPASRVGGGTRGADDGELMVEVLAPEHTGWSGDAEPALFWYISAPARAKLEMSIIDDAAIDPLVEGALDPVTAPGIQRIELGERGVKLEPGIEYQWSVAVLDAGGQRSNDVVASGTVRYMPVDAELASRLESAEDGERVRLLAENGYWYDLIDTLAELIEKHPDDGVWRSRRSALLDQVGLAEIAAFERSSE
jgi:hypothetical protein